MIMGFDGSRKIDRDELETFVRAAEKQASKLNAERHHVIVSGVELEEALGELLENFLVDQKQSLHLLRGPLNNFATRINLAYSLGLISQDEYSDLHTMREIRNRFAHGKQGRSFTDKDIKEFCDKLITIRKNFLESDEGMMLYLDSAQVLLYLLSDRIREAQQKRCTNPEEISPKKWYDL